jgi:MFS family permease
VTLGQYGRILRAPGAAHVFSGLTFSRVALGGTGLMILLFIRSEAGSFAAAGAVVAGYTVAAGVTSPLYGRLADRRGQTIAIVAPLAFYIAGMTALIAAGLDGASTGVLVACAAVGGAFLPPVSALIRPLLPAITGADPRMLSASYAFDAILIEVGFISGPLIGATLISLASAAAALATMVAFVAIGAAVFASAPASRHWRPDHSEGHRGSPLRAPGMRTLISAAFTVGVAFGSLEVALPAFATAHGSGAAAGFLLALTSLASAAGGFAFGARSREGRPLHLDYLTLLLIIPAAFALMLLAPSIPVMGLLVMFAGASIAPLVAAQNELVVAVAPRMAISEAYSWMSLAITGGVAGGAVMAGVLVDASGWRAAVVCGCVVTASGGVITLTRRHTLLIAA